MANSKPLPPGTPTPASGQYQPVGPRGGKVDREVTSTKGNPLPPLPTKGGGYVIVDKTKHKG